MYVLYVYIFICIQRIYILYVYIYIYIYIYAYRINTHLWTMWTLSIRHPVESHPSPGFIPVPAGGPCLVGQRQQPGGGFPRVAKGAGPKLSGLKAGGYKACFRPKLGLRIVSLRSCPISYI